MKIPFSGSVGIYLRKYDKEIEGICSPCLFGSTLFVVAFSLVAMIITMMDMFCLIRRDCLTPCFLRSLNPKICPSLLKSFKLFSCGIHFLNYLWLFLGGLFDQPVLLMPYLAVQFINIWLLFALILLALICKFQQFNKLTIFVFAFMIHNWLHVFCCFRSHLRLTDF